MDDRTALLDPTPLIDEIARRKRRRRWLAAGVVLVSASVLSLIYAVGSWRGQLLLDQEIEQIAARGEPVWYSDLAPRPTDPAAARGRMIAAAANRLQGVPYETLAAAIAAPASLEIQNEVQPLIDKHRATLQRILAQVRSGDCRLEYDFQTYAPFNTPLPTIDRMRTAVILLRAEYRLDLARGNRSESVDSLLNLFALDAVLRYEPFAVAHFVRIADAKCMLEDLQLAIGQRLLDESALRAVDRRLAEMESGFRMGPVLQAERAAMLTTSENIRHADVSSSLINPGRGFSSAKARVLGHWWGSWIYRPRRLHQEAIMLRTISRMADLVDVPGPRAAEQFAEADLLMRDGDLPLCAAFCSDLNLREKAMGHRQRLISARLALAVCRLRERNGRLPESLADLTDSPLTNSTGLFTGQPLDYVKTGDGFVIYDGAPERGRFEVRFAH